MAPPPPTLPPLLQTLGQVLYNVPVLTVKVLVVVLPVLSCNVAVIVPVCLLELSNTALLPIIISIEYGAQIVMLVKSFKDSHLLSEVRYPVRPSYLWHLLVISEDVDQALMLMCIDVNASPSTCVNFTPKVFFNPLSSTNSYFALTAFGYVPPT